MAWLVVWTLLHPVAAAHAQVGAVMRLFGEVAEHVGQATKIRVSTAVGLEAAEAAALARRARYLANMGKTLNRTADAVELVETVHDISSLLRELSDAEADKLADKLKQDEEELLRQHTLQAVFRSLKARSSCGQSMSGLSGSESSFVGSLHVGGLCARSLALVLVDARGFLKRYAQGAHDPKHTFDAIALEHRERVKRWRAAPVDKRVFVAGAGRHAEQVRLLSGHLRSHEYQVFYFDFCSDPSQELCSPDVVGAFFASAGRQLILDGPEVRVSHLVPSEILTSRKLRRDEVLATLLVNDGAATDLRPLRGVLLKIGPTSPTPLSVEPLAIRPVSITQP